MLLKTKTSKKHQRSRSGADRHDRQVLFTRYIYIYYYYYWRSQSRNSIWPPRDDDEAAKIAVMNTTVDPTTGEECLFLPLSPSPLASSVSVRSLFNPAGNNKIISRSEHSNTSLDSLKDELLYRDDDISNNEENSNSNNTSNNNSDCYDDDDGASLSDDDDDGRSDEDESASESDYNSASDQDPEGASSNNQNDWNSSSSRLFENLKTQMMSGNSDPFTNSGINPVFMDAPLPLMSFAESPSKQVLEHPKTGYGYRLKNIAHKNSGSDPDLLMDRVSDNPTKNNYNVVTEKEPLYDKDLASANSVKLSYRNKTESVVNLSSLESPPSCPPCAQAPHATLVYSFAEKSKENRRGSERPPVHGQTYVNNNSSNDNFNNGEMRSQREQLMEASVSFDSFFESGNLATAHRVVGRRRALSPLAGADSSSSEIVHKAVDVDHEYDLMCRFDTHTVGNIQWFYFSATSPSIKDFGENKTLTVRLNINNMMKKSSLYQFGMKPLIYDPKKCQWVRGGEEIAYFRNSETYQPKKKKRKLRYSTLSFVYAFTEPNNTVYFAHCYPYTYTDLQKDIMTILNRTSTEGFVRTRDMCLTLASNTCTLLTITSIATDPEEIEKRPAVVLSARVHPGESNASYMLRGALRFLCGNSPDAKVLRDNFIFKIVPMLNPDGVVHGNYRCSLSGMDLNRRYASPSPILHPTIFSMRQLLATTQSSRGTLLFVDMHGHSRKKNAFLYGCDHGSNCLEQRLFPRVFPRLLHNVFRCDRPADGYYSYQDCDFHVRKGKEGTGRVVAWKDLGIDNAFTLEASFAGTGDNREQKKSYRKLLAALAERNSADGDKCKNDDDNNDNNNKNNKNKKSEKSPPSPLKVAPPRVCLDDENASHFGIMDFEGIGECLLRTLVHYARVGSAQDSIRENKELKTDNTTTDNGIGGSDGNAGVEIPPIASYRQTNRPVHLRRPHILPPPLLSPLTSPLVLSERTAIEQAELGCERAKAEVDVRKVLYIWQRKELEGLRRAEKETNASSSNGGDRCGANTFGTGKGRKKSKKTSESTSINLMVRSEFPAREDKNADDKANCSSVDNESALTAERTPSGIPEGEMEAVFNVENLSLDNMDDLFEGGLSEESLGSDSDPSGDNLPASDLLKNKNFQMFVQRSTVAPQLAHMELNSGRRELHKLKAKGNKGRRKKTRKERSDKKRGKKDKKLDKKATAHAPAPAPTPSTTVGEQVLGGGAVTNTISPSLSALFRERRNSRQNEPRRNSNSRKTLQMTKVQMTRRNSNAVYGGNDGSSSAGSSSIGAMSTSNSYNSLLSAEAGQNTANPNIRNSPVLRRGGGSTR